MVGRAGAQTAGSNGTSPGTGVAGQKQDDGRISINVVVADKQGHPVRGLQASDFSLLDNGQPTKILGFMAQDAEKTAGAPVHVIVVIDMVDVPFRTTAWVREELGQFLKEDGGKLGYPTSLAVLSESGLKLQQGATRDGNALMSDFDQYQTELRIVNRSGGFYAAGEMLELSLSQISQLAAYEATKPGHKLVLVISPGWPLLPFAGDQEDMAQRNWVFHSIVALTNGLREANITLYSLDPYELGRSDPFYYQTFLKPVAKAGGAEYPYLGLQVLATHTGGLVEVTGRDITGELNTAVRDAAASYELTFQGAPGDGPNAYHALKVKVDQPGVSVRTTAGYYANVQLPAAKAPRKIRGK